MVEYTEKKKNIIRCMGRALRLRMERDWNIVEFWQNSAYEGYCGMSEEEWSLFEKKYPAIAEAIFINVKKWRETLIDRMEKEFEKTMNKRKGCE